MKPYTKPLWSFVSNSGKIHRISMKLSSLIGCLQEYQQKYGNPPKGKLYMVYDVTGCEHTVEIVLNEGELIFATPIIREVGIRPFRKTVVTEPDEAIKKELESCSFSIIALLYL